MSFAPKSGHYRVSTPNLEAVEKYPYTFKWTKPTGKTVSISRVIVTLINPVEKEGTEITFSVFSTRETYSRVFRSVSDLARLCDEVSTQSITSTRSISKFYFYIEPPILLENKNDRIELTVQTKPNMGDENYAMCEGWIYDTEEVTVKEIMRPTISVKIGTPVSEAVKQMIENKVGAVLVRREEDVLLGSMVGIITELDLLQKVLSQRSDPSEVKVEKIITTPIIATSINTTLDDAIEMMVKKGIRRLPVEEKGRVVGIITDRDVIRAIPMYFRSASKKRVFFPY